MKDQFIFGVAWFKPEQWQALKKASVDREEMEEIHFNSSARSRYAAEKIREKYGSA